MDQTTQIQEHENKITQSTPGPVKELRAFRATMIFLAFLAAQIIFAAAVFIVGIILAMKQGTNTNNSKELAQVIQSVTPPAASLSTAGAGIAMLLISSILVRPYLKNNSPTGAAWVLGSSKRLAEGFATGLLAGLFYLLIARIFAPRIGHVSLGPIARMAATPGLPQVLWIIIALLLAPPIEEMLFRGVLYGGYRRSFGPMWAAVLTTLLFVICHVTEMLHFLPSIIGITGFAIVALLLRLRSGAVGPAIAAHFGYNAVLAIAVTYATA